VPIISGGHLAGPTHFVNRTQELKLLVDFWDRGRQPIVAVIGLGGIGKTALVAEFLRQITSDPGSSPNIVFVWNCYENQDPRSFLSNIYETLSGDDPSRYQTTELADLGTTLLLSRKRALLIFDGFEIVSDPLVSTFIMSAMRAEAKFVITSRISPLFCNYSINVTGLTRSAGELLLRRTNIQASPDEYQELVSAVHGHPLSLELIASLLESRGATGSDALRSVKSEVLRSAPLEKTITRVIGSIDNSLSSPERALLARLSLFRSGVSVKDIESLFARSEDATVSGPLANLTILAISELLASLRHKGLIVATATSQSTLFSVHPILRDYFQSAIPDRGPLHKQLGEHYINLLDVKDQPLSFETAEIIMEIVYQLTQSKNTSVEDIKKLAARLPREQTPMMLAYSSLLDAALHMEPRAKIVVPEKTNSRLRAFVSYVRDDAPQVKRLRRDLERHEIDVWQDTDKIIPGKRWKNEIRYAIESGDFFIACFSDNYAARSRTYMREELLLAVEELRLRPTDRTWFIPVMLTPTEIPAIAIGAGETLRDFQWVSLYGDWDEGISSLVRAFS
jgi:hypothetical protein